MSLATEPRLNITSRRYLGSKASLAQWIRETVFHHFGQAPRSVCDVFAGTGAVGKAFNDPATTVVANDILYSNYVCLYAWLATRSLRTARLQARMRLLNRWPAAPDNYVSRTFGGTYFSMENARRIGALREAIEEVAGDEDERMVLLASLLYAADRVANTCGHYDAWRRTMDRFEPLVMRLPDVDTEANRGNWVFCQDANDLVRRVDVDVLYLDPPYNSRQYSDTYHVLENLARWEQPPVHGVARKMDRRGLKSRYCTRDASAAFSELIAAATCRLIVVSYNNMGERGDPRSNACIPDHEIMRALERRGRVTVEAKDFRHFSAGKRVLEGHQERLFICRVCH
ncbi:MAG: DNA adenine methylase [Candidatus Xenobia bacterium]